MNGDPALQTVLPYGPATPNRVGPKGNVNVKFFDEAVDAGVDFAMLSEIKPDDGFEKAKFTKIGVGFCVDAAKWVEMLNTLKLSVGYSMENSSVVPTTVAVTHESKNTFLNAGLYYNFWQRFSLLGGYQQIVNDHIEPPVIVGVDDFSFKLTQTQWAVGLEYKVTETSKVVGRYGNIGVKNADDKTMDFSATQVELFMNVDF